MTRIKLYRYQREDGGITISPNKPEGEYTELLRLIADEGYKLVYQDIEAYVIDVESDLGWVEVEDNDLEVEE